MTLWRGTEGSWVGWRLRQVEEAHKGHREIYTMQVRGFWLGRRLRGLEKVRCFYKV